MITIQIKQLEHAAGIPIPSYATEHSAGLDVSAAIYTDVIVKPKEIKTIPTGIAISIPIGYEAQIRSRSGYAAKYGIAVLNSPGTIDADYRGEIKVILINHGQYEFIITRGMRIAQMIVAKYEKVHLHEVRLLEDTQRGINGFGSTGR